MEKRQRLVDEYKYPGFRPLSTIQNHPVDNDARIITLRRRQKKLYAAVVVKPILHSMTERHDLSAIYHAAIREFILRLKSDVLNAKFVER
jgi:hypothetical protein